MAASIEPGAFEEMSNFEALYQAYRKTRLGKRDKKEVQLFGLDAGTHLFRLHHELATGHYRMGQYRRFQVHEPKVREIRCLPFRDRIVQRSLCDNTLYPYFKDRLVYDNCACQKGKGVPLGNQTSQWFSLFYLDPLDRLVKEQLRIRWYGRYMDDWYCIHKDKAYLQECLEQITALVESLGLTLNHKTQLFPVKQGMDYLGFHLYLTDTGKVIRKLRRSSKTGMKRRLRLFRQRYAAGEMEWEDIRQHMASWRGHAAHGHTWRLREKISNEAVFVRTAADK